jgi:hypothetical protein
MEPEYSPPPGAVAQPTHYTPPPTDPDEEQQAEGEVVAWAADGKYPVPELNLLDDKGQPDATPPPPAKVPDQASELPKPQAEAPKPEPTKPAPPSAKPSRRKFWVVSVVGVLVLAIAGVGAYVVVSRQSAAKLAVTTPAPTPTPLATLTPTPKASSTPSPIPSPTPALAVTVPTVAPTTDHPQTSVVTSSSGLWLRSSPTSVNRDNIIGWMPKGAEVSVDSIGDFWWHGTYKGQAGYFASKYTN